MTWVLASDWSLQITWPDAGLWLVPVLWWHVTCHSVLNMLAALQSRTRLLNNPCISLTLREHKGFLQYTSFFHVSQRHFQSQETERGICYIPRICSWYSDCWLPSIIQSMNWWWWLIVGHKWVLCPEIFKVFKLPICALLPEKSEKPKANNCIWRALINCLCNWGLDPIN